MIGYPTYDILTRRGLGLITCILFWTRGRPMCSLLFQMLFLSWISVHFVGLATVVDSDTGLLDGKYNSMLEVVLGIPFVASGEKLCSWVGWSYCLVIYLSPLYISAFGKLMIIVITFCQKMLINTYVSQWTTYEVFFHQWKKD